MAQPNQLKFSCNWNNKLSCAAFTTLRLYNPKRYRIRETYRVYLQPKGKDPEFLGTAQLVGIRRTNLSQLNQFVAYLDTGYSLPQCTSIIERMYGTGKDHVLGLYLFKWVSVEKTASINVKQLRAQLDTLSATVDRLSQQLEEVGKQQASHE